MKSLTNDCADHLYVFESSCGHIKIGRARDVDARLRQLSATCPPSITLSVLAVAEHHGDWEYGFHELLARFRARNEWFTSEAAAWIREQLKMASLAIVVRKLARRTGRSRGQKLTGPDDRRSTKFVAKRRRRWEWER